MHVIVGHPMQRAADISGFYKGTALPLRDNLMTRENEMAGIDASIRRAIKEDRLHPRCKADLDRLSLANSSMPDSDIWLDVRAVELYFQVDRRRVYRLIESGRLPHERVGRKILISKQAASVALASPERKR